MRLRVKWLPRNNKQQYFSLLVFGDKYKAPANAGSVDDKIRPPAASNKVRVAPLGQLLTMTAYWQGLRAERE